MKQLGAWKITLPGETFTWEPDEMMCSDWGECEDAYGGKFLDWAASIADGDARACQVLIWFLRRKKGIDLSLDDVNFKIRQLELERIKDPEDEAATSPSVAATSDNSPALDTAPATSTP